jgi:hypothetical protein
MLLPVLLLAGSTAALASGSPSTTLRSGAAIIKTDDLAAAGAPPLPPSNPVLITDGGYNVTFTRANHHQPIISSHFPPGSDGYSAFFFNLVPAFLKVSTCTACGRLAACLET